MLSPERRPTRPSAYDDYLRSIAADSDEWPDHPDVGGTGPQLTARIALGVERRAGELTALSHDVHAHPELAFEERHAVAAARELLERQGYDVQVGAWGLDTAFRVVAGSDGPHVAILAEYDALPDVGHGCGHNVICASAVGAFLALADVLDRLPGQVSLIGTPAEEGGGGKELIARAGGFDDVDAAMMVHPAGSDVGECRWLGLRQVDVVYHGLSAHAAALPYMGRNALDAVVAAYQSIASLRQHMLPVDRIHGVITDGGSKPNIVPERAAASFYVRSPTIATLDELTDRMDAIFAAAALSTATVAEPDWQVAPVYLPVRTNRELAARYVGALRARGRPIRTIAAVPSGSTDMGNVSVRVPSIHPKIAIGPATISAHSHEFARWAVSAEADTAVVDGAIGLATCAADFLADARLRERVRAEFERSGGRVDVAALDR
ncbi:MAG TPA: M20 family metallopeptidase [Jatrophihabitantaceae bacterium]|jgi:amidohydrolase